MDTVRVLFSKIRAFFFYFQHDVQTMPGLWIYLVILHTPGHVTYSVLNMSEFWIWHRCICKGYTQFWICLRMIEYASIMPEYAIMSLTMREYDLILQNVPEYAWKWLNEMPQYASSSVIWQVLNMPQALNMPGFWVCCNNVITTLLLYLMLY